MRDLGAATAESMVLAFLQAEIDSPRFGQAYSQILANSGLTRSLIDQADLSDRHANATRRELLGKVRGYGGDQLLFSGFPKTVSWKRIELRGRELGDLLYANYPSWVELSGGTRKVADGARNALTAANEKSANVIATAERVRAGETFPDLIAASTELGIVLMEGHTRATAYVLAPIQNPVTLLVAEGEGIQGWAFA